MLLKGTIEPSINSAWPELLPPAFVLAADGQRSETSCFVAICWSPAGVASEILSAVHARSSPLPVVPSSRVTTTLAATDTPGRIAQTRVQAASRLRLQLRRKRRRIMDDRPTP